MRTCQSCGRQNPPDRDFCECGEYLAWEPTGVVEAVAPPSEPAPPPAAPPPAPAAPAAGGSPPPPPPPQRAPTAVQQPAAQPPPEAAPPAAEPATITLSLPDEETVKDEVLAVGVHPGDRVRVRALVRNQSGIVDNYQIAVQGLPDGWWTVLPDTVYLVPYGSGGSYEQEVEIQLHPPRAPEAEARIWELQVIANSKAHARTAATAPLLLGIQPFEEVDTKIKPERASGRRKAAFKVTVGNKANAPVFVGFDASDPDNDCRFRFAPPTAEIEPGRTTETSLRVRPPKQIWIGRPQERRLEVHTRTGEAAAALEAAAADGDGDDGNRLGRLDIPGVQGPRISKPQFYKPDVHIGPGGVQVQKPMIQGPHVQGPYAHGLNVGQLKMPGGQAPPSVTGPLLPTQAVFRQKPWLPWWMAIVVPLLAALGVFLFLFLPKNVEVPDVIGKKSAFEAEQAVTEAKLVLAPDPEKKVDGRVPPGTVLRQTPDAGAKAEEGEAVTILVATGDGKVDVPSLTGQTPAEVEKTLREAKLTRGQAAPQPVDPKATVKTQVPVENEVVPEGTPVDFFLAVPGEKKGGKSGAGGTAVAAGGANSGGDGGGDNGGGGDGGPIVIPAIEGTQTAYAHKLADLKLTPKVQTEFDETPKGTVFRVDPAPGKEAQAGQVVTLFVSAGFPALAYDNDKDVLLVDTAKSKPLKPIATGSESERDPAWSADGSAIAYTSDGRIFLSDRTKPDEPAKPITAPGKRYSDLAFARTGRDVLAMAEITQGATPDEPPTSDLCLGRVQDGGLEPACKKEPDFNIERAIHWSPDGKEILAWGFRTGTTEFGIVQWTTKKPFSVDPEQWSAGRMKTDTSRPGEGVVDAAVSPDGKQMAVARIGQSGRPELVLAKRGDFPLADAKRLRVSACKVIWRPDGRYLVVVRSDDCFGPATGELMQLPVDDPQSLRSLNLAGDNPVFQPLSTAG